MEMSASSFLMRFMAMVCGFMGGGREKVGGVAPAPVGEVKWTRKIIR